MPAINPDALGIQNRMLDEQAAHDKLEIMHRVLTGLPRAELRRLKALIAKESKREQRREDNRTKTYFPRKK